MTERGLTPRVPRPAVRLCGTLPVSTLSSVLTARAGIQASGSSLHLTHSSIIIHTLPLFSAESEYDQVKSTLAFLLFPWLIGWPALLSTSCPPFQPHRTPQHSPKQTLRFPILVASARSLSPGALLPPAMSSTVQFPGCQLGEALSTQCFS